MAHRIPISDDDRAALDRAYNDMGKEGFSAFLDAVIEDMTRRGQIQQLPASRLGVALIERAALILRTRAVPA